MYILKNSTLKSIFIYCVLFLSLVFQTISATEQENGSIPSAKKGEFGYFRLEMGSLLSEVNDNGRIPIPSVCAFIDFDNDGDPDVVIASRTQQGVLEWAPIRAYENDGTGRFTDVTKRVFSNDKIGWVTNQMQVADFNGDGFDDLFVTQCDNHNYEERTWGQNYLFLQTKNGTLKNVTSTNIPDYSSFTHNSEIGDIDNDGDIDIYLAGQGNSNTISDEDLWGPRFLINNGDGTFSDGGHLLPQLLRSSYFYSDTGALADIDGDKDLDLVLGCASDNFKKFQNIPILLNDGSGNFAFADENKWPKAFLDPKWGKQKDGMWTVYQPRLTDVNGDNKLDILAPIAANHDREYHLTNGRLQILINKGNGEFVDGTTKSPDNMRSMLFCTYLTDLNNDKKTDLMGFWGGIDLCVYLNMGNGKLVDGKNLLPFDEYRFAFDGPQSIASWWIVGDIDNDGDDDFYTVSEENGGTWRHYIVRNLKKFKLQKATLKTPRTPKAIAPKANAELTAVPELLWIWDKRRAVKYELQVSKDNSFNKFQIHEKHLIKNYFQCSELGNGTYYWRVRAIGLEKTGKWSSPRNFAIKK